MQLLLFINKNNTFGLYFSHPCLSLQNVFKTANLTNQINQAYFSMRMTVTQKSPPPAVLFACWGSCKKNWQTSCVDQSSSSCSQQSEDKTARDWTAWDITGRVIVPKMNFMGDVLCSLEVMLWMFNAIIGCIQHFISVLMPNEVKQFMNKTTSQTLHQLSLWMH